MVDKSRINETLYTDRLILRKLTMDDADDFFIFASDPEVSRYVTWDTHKDIESLIPYINLVIEKYQRQELSDWGIVLKSTGKLIGTINAVPAYEHHRAEVGYTLNRTYWNQGYMTEALTAVIEYCFDVLELNRVEASHMIGNTASGLVMKKAGMTYEGLSREKFFIKGKFVDLENYAIIKKDLKKIMQPQE
jgi:ribosomal-protein-alanine N-acetyltransferase